MNKPLNKEKPSYGDNARFLIDTIDYVSKKNEDQPFGAGDVKQVISEYTDVELKQLLAACQDIINNLPQVWETLYKIYVDREGKKIVSDALDKVTKS